MTAFAKVYDSLSPEAQTSVREHIARVVDRTKRVTASRLRLVKEVRAGPIRLEAVEFEGRITYTMAFDNDVMAHMGEEAAKLFVSFVTETPALPGAPQVPPTAEHDDG